MRTLIDLEHQNLAALDRLAKSEGRSRAAIIREAVGEYLERRKSMELDDAFGLWGQHRVDGLAYQEKLRSEW